MDRIDHRKATAAHATTHQPGEEVSRPPGALGAKSSFRLHSNAPACVLLACFDLVPEFLIDYAQFGNRLDYPIAWLVQPRHSFPGFGILDVPKPIPDELADVELVVEDAGA